jgi:hypothetical protein
MKEVSEDSVEDSELDENKMLAALKIDSSDSEAELRRGANGEIYASDSESDSEGSDSGYIPRFKIAAYSKEEQDKI